MLSVDAQDVRQNGFGEFGTETAPMLTIPAGKPKPPKPADLVREIDVNTLNFES